MLMRIYEQLEKKIGSVYDFSIKRSVEEVINKFNSVSPENPFYHGVVGSVFDGIGEILGEDTFKKVLFMDMYPILRSKKDMLKDVNLPQNVKNLKENRVILFDYLLAQYLPRVLKKEGIVESYKGNVKRIKKE